jgi:L-aspartate oxidase
VSPRSAAHATTVVATDVVVVGAGVAGLVAALGVAPRRVALLTKTPLGYGGASVMAQGGVAAAIGGGDSTADHGADTCAAGAGLCDARTVDILAGEGPAAVRRLIERGARFDRTPDGRLALGREGAHRRARILHATDATGAEMVRALTEAVRAAPSIATCAGTVALELVVAGGHIDGVVALDPDGHAVWYRARAVVLATGGIGQLYRFTTNPPESTGDGLALAARAGARLVDLEFVQFHPTALAVGADPMPLLTEALRGEGALLVDADGRRFMGAEHPLAELAPRDVVARAIWRRQEAGGRVYLDARQAVGDRFPVRFPTVFALCRAYGLDPRRDLLPVSPAAHYHMGGIAVDSWGRASVAGLWACGEVASTGVHGANRLASNSLLEALVFGSRVAEDIARTPAAASSRGAERSVAGLDDGTTGLPPAVRDRRSGMRGSRRSSGAVDPAQVVRDLRGLMWAHVGLVRDEDGLTEALARLDELGRDIGDGITLRATSDAGVSAARQTARNMVTVARLVATAARARRESRGGHFRRDVPETVDRWQRRLFVTAGDGGLVRIEAGPPVATPADVPARREVVA